MNTLTIRRGDWLQVASGGQMYPLDPRPEEIHIGDISAALSKLCRFNGHTSRFYSVAEHCCHVHDILLDRLKLAGLLHDASEAYLCDMPRPIKRSAGFAGPYMEAEDALMHVIAVRFGFDWPMPPAVAAADNALLGTESAQLMAPLHPEWRDHFAPVDGLVLPCWGPEQARREFMARFVAATGATTPEAIFEDLAERIATARTRWLMGEHEEAREMLQQARLDYLRYREVLADVTPGWMALVRALEATEGVITP